MPIDLLETRALTVELSEAEWLALRSVEHDPVAYLKAQVRRRLGGQESEIVGRPHPDTETDDY